MNAAAEPYDGPEPARGPRVFVAVGTDIHPFARLIEWTDEWAGRHPGEGECFVQYGHTRAPRHCAGEGFLDHVALTDRMTEADIVVCHGGPTTIAESRRRGVRPIVVPRVSALGEHVDDHQVRFARRLAASDLVWLAEDPDEYRALLDKAVADPSVVRLEHADRESNDAAVRRFGDLVGGLFATRRARRARRAR